MTNNQPKADILVVDDHAANLQVLQGMLATADYKVRGVLNGKMALAAARAAAPDLILLDIRMPDMDGYEVCRELKADPQLQHIPVIFISAMIGEIDEDLITAAGAVDYIGKPFQIDDLLNKIARHLTILK